METVDCLQRTEEWYKARLGVPTSSNFDKIVTTDGSPSKQAQKYMYQLAGERVSGMSEETYQSAAMLKGIELEAEAKKLYQLINDLIVIDVGLCLSDGPYKYGASPDGLIGKDGLIEIKCPYVKAIHVGYLIDGVLPKSYFQQVQGQLLVTGRKWVDFVSYSPGIKPFIIRVDRDEEFISKLRSALESFCQELDEIVRKIR